MGVIWAGRPSVAAPAAQQACVQESAAVIAPKLLGGDSARTPVGDLGFTEMDQVMVLSDLHAQRLGRDLLLQQRLV
ncbi:MAG: hypothetical protein GKR83_12985 [Synechococcus sp. s2_metabat2_7]|nr:hypothetical protein [Synechococcus sp. s2_metabat2_7]